MDRIRDEYIRGTDQAVGLGDKLQGARYSGEIVDVFNKGS